MPPKLDQMTKKATRLSLSQPIQKKPFNKEPSRRQVKIAKPVDDNIGILSNEPVKPDDQLKLTDEELDELISNVLQVVEPTESTARVVYNYKDGAFIPYTNSFPFITLIELKSTLVHQLISDLRGNNNGTKLLEVKEETYQDKEDHATDMDENVEQIHEEVEEGESEGEGDFPNDERDGGDEIDEEKTSKPKAASDSDEEAPETIKEEFKTNTNLSTKQKCAPKKLMNQFNFFERCALTEEIILRDKEVQTTPPMKNDFCTYTTQWIIYDAYNEDYLKQQEEKEKEKKDKIVVHGSKKSTYKNKKYDVTEDQTEKSMLMAAKFLERIINLNAMDAIAQDFRYYEDPSDQFRGREGTLLPLWTMTYDKAHNLYVTDISWSPDYFDLFAVTLGTSQGHFPLIDSPSVGYVCLWSLKNPSYPEYINQTHCGAMCLDFHRDRGFLLAVGFHDGHLAVYNVSLPSKEAQYMTDSVNTKHMACVRQVVWAKDLPDGELNFYSISEDGTVCNWLLMQSEMSKTIIVTLILDIEPQITLGGKSETLIGRGTTIAFHPENNGIYLVGTNEGYIFKCNIEWSSYFMQKFKAHEMTICRIDYNKYDPNIYLSCSGDCTVKIWEDKSDVPLLIFDLLRSVSDVLWSPFSSTVFGVVTEDCDVVFYDLDADKYKHICCQPVQSDSQYELSKFAFNWRMPVIVVGSSKSTVITLKMSPNLRLVMKPPKKGKHYTTQMLELEKLHKALDSTREPDTLAIIADDETTDS
ncbi:WD40/YVTN repeat-like-containing domain,WD40 repeat,WD40-repeat-containing domain [Cinara cedri]|uniref:WD40/YVTN repeat-like-containing domain,WD40 repeat,WD40-repeat-containing domain n=1 Tax=Cinara cedri TaxID=506608 RepID=A0A5E4M6C7_9HEMI|nr:WD40/YVTN repeat-like-containing domain,WD40 repeat,WD40-repeat-containing domain [Cinara cedri]